MMMSAGVSFKGARRRGIAGAFCAESVRWCRVMCDDVMHQTDDVCATIVLGGVAVTMTFLLTFLFLP